MLDRIFHRGVERDMTRMDNVGSNVSAPAADNIPTAGSRIYYYYGVIYNGEPVVLGRFYTWEQANNIGRSKIPVPGRVFPLTTGDMRKATKIVKYQLLNGNNLDEVMQRARHVLPPDGEDETI